MKIEKKKKKSPNHTTTFALKWKQKTRQNEMPTKKGFRQLKTVEKKIGRADLNEKKNRLRTNHHHNKWKRYWFLCVNMIYIWKFLYGPNEFIYFLFRFKERKYITEIRQKVLCQTRTFIYLCLHIYIFLRKKRPKRKIHTE